MKNNIIWVLSISVVIVVMFIGAASFSHNCKSIENRISNLETDYLLIEFSTDIFKTDMKKRLAIEKLKRLKLLISMNKDSSAYKEDVELIEKLVNQKGE